MQAREDGLRKASLPDELEIVAEQVANLDRSEAVTVTESTFFSGKPGYRRHLGANDEMALGAIEALKAQGLNVKVIVGGLNYA